MVDKVKVIKGLEHCANDCSKTCPYFYADECHAVLASDVLAMLRESNKRNNDAYDDFGDILDAIGECVNKMWGVRETLLLPVKGRGNKHDG